jgi:hypothetical protein
LLVTRHLTTALTSVTGYFAKPCCQTQQADLVFNDILFKTTYGVTPLHFSALVDKDLHLYQTG